MWVVACFVDEDNVEVVPYSWMKEDGWCYWPALERAKLRRTIESQAEPDESSIWNKYKAKIIGRPYGIEFLFSVFCHMGLET
jgi:hypothetical protein